MTTLKLPDRAETESLCLILYYKLSIIASSPQMVRSCIPELPLLFQVMTELRTK